MARSNPGLPAATPVKIKKSELLEALTRLDADAKARARVLKLEEGFREKIEIHVKGLPTKDSAFNRFNTNPFVVMIHCRKRGYTRISQLENDILPAKEFSSMETSAGRMAEDVVFPVYGWEYVRSTMTTATSVVDGRRLDGKVLRLVTLKSGPRCLNDEMSKDIATDVVKNFQEWAIESGVREIDFTYGVLYGTQQKSNKKDWHVLRNIDEQIGRRMTVPPKDRWDCSFTQGGVDVTVTVRLGIDWWQHLGGDGCFVEICAALVRACVAPGDQDPADHTYQISDLHQIVSMEVVPKKFNVSIVQRSQLPWIFFMARHFCDELLDA